MDTMRNILFYVLVIILESSGIFAKRGGYMNLQFLCYNNPGHLGSSGTECNSFTPRNCDPYFIICVSNKPIEGKSDIKCPLFYLNTKLYYHQGSVCNKPVDNRRELKSIPDIELPFPLEETYYVRIVVKHKSNTTKDPILSAFVTSFSATPSGNLKDFRNKDIAMNNEKTSTLNSNTWLIISLGLKCNLNFFGKQCNTFCNSSKSANHDCSEEGKKICKDGWIGLHCDKGDLCRTMVCAKGATCVYRDYEPKCFCNGDIGPQCDLLKNPCNPNPCLNGGKCTYNELSGTDQSCSCTFPFEGYRCQRKINQCEIDSCLNNGTCTVLSNGTRSCKCLSNFKGILCEHSIGTSAIGGLYVAKLNYNGISIGFVIIIIILSVIGIGLLVKWRQKLINIFRRKKLQTSQSESENPPRPSEDSMTDNDDTYDQIKPNGSEPSAPKYLDYDCVHSIIDQYEEEEENVGTHDNDESIEYRVSLIEGSHVYYKYDDT